VEEVESMRPVVYAAPLTLEACEWPEPETAEGEALVAVRAAGICGSELDGVRSRSPLRAPPLIMGHEFGGIRRDTGERVAVNPIVTCGRCDLCQAGMTEICRARQIIGVHRPGAFAELVSVPVANCHTLPGSVADVQGALVEPFANAVHARRLALELASQKVVARVGVIGAGAVGLAVSTLCAEDHALEVVVCEIDERRREIARAVAQVQAAEDFDGEFDIVFDAVGSAETRRKSVERLRPGGVAVWIGLHSPQSDVDGQALVRSEKRIVGSFAYSAAEFDVAVRTVGRVQPKWAQTYPLSQGADVFVGLLGVAGRAPRTVLVPDNGASTDSGEK
jgi:threonine dehydrogenase-like Zn-dependent dehydrogenase